MPMLVVVKTSWPSRSKGVLHGLVDLAGHGDDLPVAAEPGSSSTNSSPPRRLRVSPRRMQEFSRWAMALQQQVAAVVAERIVDVLEVVQVAEQQRHAPARSGAPSPRARSSCSRKKARLGSRVSVS